MGKVLALPPARLKPPKLGISAVTAGVVVTFPNKKAEENEEEEGERTGKISLGEVRDGRYCTLECGCVVRRMTMSSRTPREINVWLHGSCPNFTTNRNLTDPACMIGRDFPIRQLAGGVLSTYLPDRTSVTYDPLTSALAAEFE